MKDKVSGWREGCWCEYRSSCLFLAYRTSKRLQDYPCIQDKFTSPGLSTYTGREHVSRTILAYITSKRLQDYPCKQDEYTSRSPSLYPGRVISRSVLVHVSHGPFLYTGQVHFSRFILVYRTIVQVSPGPSLYKGRDRI